MKTLLKTNLPHRMIVRISGPDAASFLHNLVSNDVLSLPMGTMQSATLLNAQGKLLVDMLIIRHEASVFDLDIDKSNAELVFTLLTRYRLRAHVDFTPCTKILWALWSSEPSPLPFGYRDPRHRALGHRIISDHNHDPDIPASVVEYDAYDQHRILCGVADGPRDMGVGQTTLIEGNYDRHAGISWSKGCYIGQEVTARMHHRNLAKRRLAPVKLSAPNPIAFDTPIMLNDQVIGSMRSQCGNLGLALLPTTPHTKGSLTCNGCFVTPFIPSEG